MIVEGGMSMSGISPVSSISYMDYGRFASGKKIQSAADGASELSIIQKQDTQARGYEVGANNMQTANDMLKVADGAMGGITDYLQRIRELAVQASNTAIMSDDDRAAIQVEVEHMKQGIADLASNTTFNNKQILNGANQNLSITTDGNGNKMQAELSNVMLEELGIADFDVTKDFDIADIDKALEKVSSGRSSMGAQSNALEYAYNYNKNAALNTIGSKSRLEDLDIPQAISDLKKKQTLQEYAMFMQKRMMEDETNRMKMFFM